MVKLERELNEIINAVEDQVLFVSLGPTESRGARHPVHRFAVFED